jgi:hypothetical protein
MKTKDIKRNIKGVFKLPVKKFYFGKILYGNPYYTPWNFNSFVLTIRKEKPKFLRCNHFKLFGFDISYGWPIIISTYELGWKDKYGTPRFEWSPAFQLYFFKWQVCVWDASPFKDEELYWEMILWYMNYSNNDLDKAKKTWGWRDSKTKKSTWNDEFLITK